MTQSVYLKRLQNVEEIVGIVSELVELSGIRVEAFTPFKPYKLQRVSMIDQHNGQIVKKEFRPPPRKYDSPTDKYEYEDWIQDKIMEQWQKLADRETERQELKRANREEVMRVVEEKWKAPPLVSLRTIYKMELDERNNPKDPLEPDVHDIEDDATVITPPSEDQQ